MGIEHTPPKSSYNLRKKNLGPEAGTIPKEKPRTKETDSETSEKPCPQELAPSSSQGAGTGIYLLEMVGISTAKGKGRSSLSRERTSISDGGVSRSSSPTSQNRFGVSTSRSLSRGASRQHKEQLDEDYGEGACALPPCVKKTTDQMYLPLPKFEIGCNLKNVCCNNANRGAEESVASERGNDDLLHLVDRVVEDIQSLRALPDTRGSHSDDSAGASFIHYMSTLEKNRKLPGIATPG